VWQAGRVQHREFWQCVDTVLGVGPGRTLTSSHVLGALADRTAQEALDAGVEPGVVWRALCVELDVPEVYRWGLPEPR